MAKGLWARVEYGVACIILIRVDWWSVRNDHYSTGHGPHIKIYGYVN
jgi:hypothetical protein